jgi:hypothetical protein
MSYRPNVDAAIFFVRDIRPRILATRHSAVFHIVGGDAPPEVTRLASTNVVVTGSVDGAALRGQGGGTCVPLRMGSGTRLKVLEGLSMGSPHRLDAKESIWCMGSIS